jgi:transposase
MQIASVGIDLGKTTFHLVALDERSQVVIRKKFSRKQLLAFTANLQSSLIGLEACSGAHFLGASLRKQGHDARLMPAQFVKPFVKSNKNDFLDAEAIAEAVARQNMRFVPIKTDDQLDLQALHRVRDRLQMYPSGTERNPRWSIRPLPTPSSMRNVDATCDTAVVFSFPEPE